MSAIIWICTIGFVLLLIGNLFTGPLQHLFIFRPVTLEPEFEYEFSVPFEEVWIDGKNGGKINALHFKSKTQKPKGVVLYFHGNSENLFRWGNLYMDFVPNGYDFFVMDYRGFGKSTGSLTPYTFTDDAMRCWNYLSKSYSSENIIIYGRSMGGAAACYVASKVSAKHLVLETPYSSIPSLFYSYYPFFPPLFIFRFRFPNFKWVKRVKFPISIFHGTRDRVTPISCSSKLKKSLKPEDKYITIWRGSHHDLNKYEVYREEMTRIFS